MFRRSARLGSGSRLALSSSMSAANDLQTGRATEPVSPLSGWLADALNIVGPEAVRPMGPTQLLGAAVPVRSASRAPPVVPPDWPPR